MSRNAESLLERDERLENLENRTAVLQESVSFFGNLVYQYEISIG